MDHDEVEATTDNEDAALKTRLDNKNGCFEETTTPRRFSSSSSSSSRSRSSSTSTTSHEGPRKTQEDVEDQKAETKQKTITLDNVTLELASMEITKVNIQICEKDEILSTTKEDNHEDESHENKDKEDEKGHSEEIIELETVEENGDSKKNNNDDDDAVTPNGVILLSTNGVKKEPRSPKMPAARSKVKDVVKERRKDKRSKRDKKKKQDELHCSYCNATFFTKPDFQNHCRSDTHQHLIMSDEGRSWKYRPPPHGFGSDTYRLCEQQQSKEGFCRLGNQCVEAHCLDELREWKDRFDYRQKRAQRAQKMYGKSFGDILLDKLASAKNQDTILKTQLDGVECKCDGDLNVTVSSKASQHVWIFQLASNNKIMKNIALMNDTNRLQFSLAYIKHVGEDKNEEEPKLLKTFSIDPEDHVQEWVHPEPHLFATHKRHKYRVKVSFKAAIFGTFRQSIIFSFGSEPHLRQDLCVDVKPLSSNEENQLKVLQETIIQQSERWDKANTTIKDFDPPLDCPAAEDNELYVKYAAPQPSKFKPSKSVIDPHLTKHNYRNRMHELLFIEEMAQFEQVSQFNVITKLSLISRYLLMPTSTNSSTAKYARPGELFAKMMLGANLSEDTTAGRLILTSCSSLLLAKSRGAKAKVEKRISYVADIEDTGKSTLYLRLSPTLIQDWSLKEDMDVEVEVQFQLNRLPMCEMHHAVDKLPDLSLAYPDVREPVQIPWTPGKQWSDELSSKLNPKQREAILAVTTPLDIQLPPILIIGPYGTGKTFTLAQAIKLLLKQNGSRVLVCTHSNSAADLYIREYMDPYIEQNPDVKLLRVYYKRRWVQTVHQTVQKYCLITQKDGARTFRNPTLEDVKDCNVVVATLSTSRFLSGIGLQSGHFTHILLDEAAQAMECEAIMPLAMSSSKTRVVLAGDHMQLSPEVFSQFAQERRFNKSLLERLYDHYPQNFRCKILLCENYRSHEAIINYTSELFYEQKLIASGKQMSHPHWYPLTVFTARGEDVQDVNSTSFYNNAEVYEVVERVSELQRTWPTEWGTRDENSIGIVTPYYDQVQRIRSELRKRRLFGVSVERVLNVQGKQFRAIFLSTVRTRKTCIVAAEDTSDLDFGFLSNAKLLNTAITRAQSLVAVVGDPVALCSVGKCRKLWERFVDMCRKHRSMFGLTWAALRTMLDGVDLKKTVLNPLAPEFVPRAKRYRETFLQNVYSYVQAEAARQASSFFNNTAMLPYYPPAAAFGGGYQQQWYSNPPPIPPQTRPPIHPYMGLVPPPPPSMMIPPLPPPLSAWRMMDPSMTFPPGGTMTMPPPRPPPPSPIASNFGGAVPNFVPMMMRSDGRSASSPALNLSPSRLQFNKMPPCPAGSVVNTSSKQRQANPQFSNSKYQRHMMPMTSLPNNVAAAAAAVQTVVGCGLLPQPLMSLSVPPPKVVNPEAATTDKSYTFLKDGVHFPQVPATPPPTSMVDVHRRQQQQHVVETTNHKSLMDTALDVLPHDMDLGQFLQSPQLQMAWYNHLTLSKSANEALLFTELVFSLQQNVELLATIKQLLENRKVQQQQSFGVDDKRVTNDKPVVLAAQDLEATWLRESAKPSNKRYDKSSSNVLMPSASSADAFFSVASAFARQHQPQYSSKMDDVDVLRQDSLLSDILQTEDNGDESGQSPLSSAQSTQTSASSNSSYVPLYKRRAGGSKHQNEDQFRDKFIVTSAPDPLSLSGFVTQQFGAVLPTSSSGTTTNSAASGRTCANVLRQSQGQEASSCSDPLLKIRELGNKGNSELDQDDGSAREAAFKPFSHFGANW